MLPSLSSALASSLTKKHVTRIVALNIADRDSNDHPRGGRRRGARYYHNTAHHHHARRLGRYYHRCRKPKSSPRDNDTMPRPGYYLTDMTRRWIGGGSGSGGGGSGSDAGENDVNVISERRKHDHKHCVEMVMDRDYEGYLCGLLMPPSAREAYFALRAFNVEIASIKDSSRILAGRARGARGGGGGEPSRFADNDVYGSDAGGGDSSSLATRLRMQWWRDAISEIYDGMIATEHIDGERSNNSLLFATSISSSARRNPTLRSLANAIRAHGLTHRFLRRIIEAREADLDIAQYDRVRDVAQYGEDTASNVLYLTLECVGVRDEKTDMVASDVGVGLGMLTALRSTGFRAAHAECSIPLDLANKHSVSLDTLWIANDDETDERGKREASRRALRDAVKEMADVARFHLHRARDNQSGVPKEGRTALLPAVCGLHYLNALEESDYDVLHPSLVRGGGRGGYDDNASSGSERRRRLGLMFLLGRSWLTGTF